METLLGRYKIIYVSEDDFTSTHYLNDLFRRELQKGKVGIFSEDDSMFGIVKGKLIELFSKNNELNFVKCGKIAVDVESEEYFFCGQNC